jgi:hypothetical protein
LIIFDVYSLDSDAAVAKFSNFFPEQQKCPKIPLIFPKILKIPKNPQYSQIPKNPNNPRNSVKNPDYPKLPAEKSYRVSTPRGLEASYGVLYILIIASVKTILPLPPLTNHADIRST